MTLTALIIDNNTIRPTDFSDPVNVRKEMVQNPEESLWIHSDEPEDIFQLQGVFGLHPLSVEAVTHENQPSKIEEYDEYLFTIIDGVSYGEIKIGERRSELIAGAIVGSTFYIFSYPMIVWVFAIPFDMQIANLEGIEAISILTSNFLGTLPTALSITIVPGALMGMLGAYIFSKKIAVPQSPGSGIPTTGIIEQGQS